MATKWHKRILSDFSRIRGLNNFQLSRRHLKGVSLEVDWLFPIWKTVMTGKEKKKKKREREKQIGFLQFPWVDFIKGESFWSLSYPILLQPESQESPGHSADPRQAEAWQPPGDWIPRQVEAGGPPDNWVPGQVEACQPPGTPELADSLRRLKRDKLSRTRSLGRSTFWDTELDLESPRSPAWPVLGRIKGL